MKKLQEYLPFKFCPFNQIRGKTIKKIIWLLDSKDGINDDEYGIAIRFVDDSVFIIDFQEMAVNEDVADMFHIAIKLGSLTELKSSMIQNEISKERRKEFLDNRYQEYLKLKKIYEPEKSS